MEEVLAHLPGNLHRVFKLAESHGTVDAAFVALKLNIDRARASGYLNELERLGFLGRFRHKRRVEFFIRKKPSEESLAKVQKDGVSLKTISQRFDKARYWLKRIVNSDGGWGQFEGDTSHVVNTAESVLALSLMGESKESTVIEEGRAFIIKKLQNLKQSREITESINSEMESARSVARMGLVLSDVYDDASAERPDAIRIVVSWLRRNQDREGYWDLGSTYSTAMSMRYLALFDDSISEAQVSLAMNWLLKVFDSIKGGWECKPGHNFNLAATAHVLFSLSKIGCKHEKMMIARDLLVREVDSWSGVMEELFKPQRAKPFLWKHFPLSCILAALLSIGEDPKSVVILEGIQMLLDLQDESGGWRVVKGETPKTWATLNAAIALSEFKSKISG